MQLTALCKVLRYPALLNPKSWLIMKLTTILILAGCLQVSARTFAQTVTLSVKNTSLEKIFLEIKKQTGYNFVYNDRFGSTAKPVTVAVKQQPLASVLEECFRDQNFTFEIIDKTIIIKEKAPQKKENDQILPPALIDVKGKVVNEKGEPLAGVSVLVKGTKRGTSTDENGVFELKALNDDAVIQFSGVNIESYETKLNGRTQLNFTAKAKVNKLEEVEITAVNTGYQNLSKERATGSFATISNQLYNEQTGTNVLSRLESISNGLIFDRKAGNNTTSNITIRGLSTIQGPRSPLVVIDNFAYDGDINNINPNDVENITILKDAAAASIWGTKAGNGVIVITTKRGKFNQATRIQVNSSIAIGDKPDLYSRREISPADFVEVEKMLYTRGFYTSMINSSSRPVLSPVIELLAQKNSGAIPAAEADARINAFKMHDVRDDFNNYLYSKSVNQQYNINMQGGDKNVAWAFSGGVDKNNSESEDIYNRINLKSDNVFKISNKLQLNAGVQYTQSRSKVGRPGYGQLNTNNGSIPIYTYLADAAGNAIPVINNIRQTYLDTAGGGKLLNWNYYPLEDYKYVDNTNNLQDITGNLGLKYNIIQGLSVIVKYQYERQTNSSRILYGEQSYFARNLINGFSQINAGKVTNIIPKGSIIDNRMDQIEAHNVRGELTYNREWHNSSLNVIGGAEIRNNHSTGNSSRDYGYNDNILTTGRVDYVNTYPNFVTKSTSNIPGNNGYSDKLLRYVSYFGNAAYSYQKKYILSLSMRRDASNLFGVDYNQKSIPLWSAGASWDISNEKFYRSQFIPYLRLRTTYGVSGNADPNRSAVTTITYGLNSSYTLTPVARIQQYANPSLRWERVTMFNIGVDFNSRNNTISGSVEYFRKKGIDLFGSIPIDYTNAGIPSLVKNTASIKGYGWDIALNTLNFQGAFKWTTNLNLSVNKETVLSYYLPSPQIVNFTQGGANISALIGLPVYALYGFKWAGLDAVNGDPKGNLDGKESKDYSAILGSTNQDNLVFKGSALPVVSGNIGNTISWKKISLVVRLNYKLGYWFQRRSINYGNLFSSRQGNSDFALRWQNPGDELNTYVPSMTYPRNTNRDSYYQGSEVLLEKADHIRLQYVTVGYDINQATFKKLPFKMLQVYFNMNNLGIIWRANKKGIDPDFYNGIPTPKTLVVGVRANF